MGFIENDIGIRERAPTHECQGRDLDLAAGDARRHLLARKRVVERTQIGIDLLLQIARQKAQALARLDRRPRQDDPVDLAADQHLYRFGHGKIGFPGPRRSDPKDQILGRQGPDIGGLARRTRRNQPLTGRDRQVLGMNGARLVRLALLVTGARHPHRGIDLGFGDLQAFFQALVKRLQRRAGRIDRRRIAGDLNMIAATGQPDVQLLLDAQKVLIVLPEQERQQRVIGKLDHHRRSPGGILSLAWRAHDAAPLAGSWHSTAEGLDSAPSFDPARGISPARLLGWAVTISTGTMVPIASRPPDDGAWACTACI